MTKKNVLVVGGSSDIGQQVIKGLSEDEEYNILYTYNSNKSHANGIQASLNTHEGVVDFINRIKDLEINVLVYCPGINPTTLSKDLDIATIEEVTWVNYLSPILIINQVVKNMMKKKNPDNKIIYISSVAARKCRIGNGLYGSNKAAVERYLASLALEVGRFGIRTACIAPAFIETNMLHNICEKTGITVNSIKKGTPTGRILSPKDVSNAVISFIENKIVSTGSTISINNGEGI